MMKYRLIGVDNYNVKILSLPLAHPRIHKFRSPSVKLGEAFSLTCFATGNPKPRVWWEKKDEKTSTFEHVDNKQSEVLHFKAVDESNLGSYRCFAQNGFKTVKKDVQLGLCLLPNSYTRWLFVCVSKLN